MAIIKREKISLKKRFNSNNFRRLLPTKICGHFWIALMFCTTRRAPTPCRPNLHFARFTLLKNLARFWPWIVRLLQGIHFCANLLAHFLITPKAVWPLCFLYICATLARFSPSQHCVDWAEHCGIVHWVSLIMFI